MQKRWKSWSIVCAVALCAGCATPTPEQVRYVQQARAEISDVLGDFAAAIREKDEAAAKALLSPHMIPLERMHTVQSIETSMWRQFYAGYEVDLERSLARVRRKALERGAVQVRAYASNTRGERFEDRYSLERTSRENWHIAAVRFQEVQRREPLDPPPLERERLHSLAARIVELLKDGKSAHVFYMLPVEGAKSGSLGFDLGPGARRRLQLDLRMIDELSVVRWPDLEDGLRLGYLGPGMASIMLDIVFAYQRGHGVEPYMITLEVYALRDDGQWRVATMFVHGLD